MGTHQSVWSRNAKGWYSQASTSRMSHRGCTHTETCISCCDSLHCKQCKGQSKAAKGIRLPDQLYAPELSRLPSAVRQVDLNSRQHSDQTQLKRHSRMLTQTGYVCMGERCKYIRTKWSCSLL